MNKTKFFKKSLDLLHNTGAHVLIEPYTKGMGMFLTLHHVRPEKGHDFNPNGLLEVTPEFLDQTLSRLKHHGLELVSIDEAAYRLKNKTSSDQRFAVITLDDGYKDNIEHALPVFEEHQCPHTIYIATDFIKGKGELWWMALELIIRDNEFIKIDENEEKHPGYQTVSLHEKEHAYHEIYWHMRSMSEDEQRVFIRELCKRYAFDLYGLCQDQVMSLDMLKQHAKHPLVTIGAHTLTHRAIAKLTMDDARYEMAQSQLVLKEWLGEAPKHFSYPYGSKECADLRDFQMAKELGFETAVTTRKGMLYKEHKKYMTALPRVSLNGFYQEMKYVDLFVTGVPFVLAHKMQLLDVS